MNFIKNIIKNRKRRIEAVNFAQYHDFYVEKQIRMAKIQATMHYDTFIRGGINR